MNARKWAKILLLELVLCYDCKCQHYNEELWLIFLVFECLFDFSRCDLI